MKDDYLYPAMIACLSESRRPDGAELKKVIRRITDELRPGRCTDARLRRRITLLSLAALGLGDRLSKHRSQRRAR